MMLRVKFLAGGVALYSLISLVYAGCSLSQQVLQCNAASKSLFATTFAAAVAVPAVGCHTMTDSQWNSVGCDSPSSHQSTKICAPATWSALLQTFATAIALKTKILVKSPYTISTLFNTSAGRALIRHELAHIRQQDGKSSFSFGYSYISEYCKAGCSYSDNIYEIEANLYQNDNC